MFTVSYIIVQNTLNMDLFIMKFCNSNIYRISFKKSTTASSGPLWYRTGLSIGYRINNISYINNKPRHNFLKYIINHRFQGKVSGEISLKVSLPTIHHSTYFPKSYETIGQYWTVASITGYIL